MSWMEVPQDKPVHRKDFYGIVLILQDPSGVKTYYKDLRPDEVSKISMFLRGRPRPVSSLKYIVPKDLESDLRSQLPSEFKEAKGRTIEKDQVLEFYLAANGRMKLAFDKKPKVAEIKPQKKAEARKGPIRVMIVDDSPTIRKVLQKAIDKMSGIEVVGETGDPKEAFGLAEKCSPDVMTLDIHMPEMNGVEVLKDMYPKKFVPAIVISSLGMKEGSLVMEALEEGAIDYLQKPSLEEYADIIPVLEEKLKIAADQKSQKVTKKDHARQNSVSSVVPLDLRKWIAIGSSTGGTEAVKVLLEGLPKQIPPILIVQHIPPFFSTAFANRLDELLPFEVKEAEDGDEIKPGRVLIAPGGLHMEAEKTAAGQQRVKIYEGDKCSGHVPSVDVLFNSIAKCHASKTVGVILTGMGKDGAKGLKNMKDNRSVTFGQDEESCVVYGMPRVAYEIGGVTHQLPLFEMAGAIVKELEVTAMKKPA